MPVQFTLTWESDDLIGVNALNQTALYRRKSVGGVFISTGFTPSNNIAKVVESALSPSLLDNVIYEFKIETNCTENGPSSNKNGIVEAINFSCLLPTIISNATQTTITLDVTGTDITKAKFILRKISDNSLAAAPVIVSKLVNSITTTIPVAAADYYWQVNLYSLVNGIEVVGTTCTPYNVTVG